MENCAVLVKINILSHKIDPMPTNLKPPQLPKALLEVNQDRVGQIVIDGLHGTLPHQPNAKMAEMIMAYVMMLKTILLSMDLSEEQSNDAKTLLDHYWSNVLIEKISIKYTAHCCINSCQYPHHGRVFALPVRPPGWQMKVNLSHFEWLVLRKSAGSALFALPN